MSRDDVQRSLSAAVAWLSVGMMTSVSAAEIRYGVDAGVGYSDNIGRTENAKQDETIGSVGLSLNLAESSNRIDAKLSSDFEYRDYIDDTFDSEVVGQLVGALDVDVIRERLKWMVEDTFGQARSDQFSADTPANRENVNYFSTGPTLNIPLTRRVSARVEGRYSDVYYEDSDLGNDRLRGVVGIQRDVSDTSTLSLLGSTESVEFDDQDQFVDFDEDEVYLRYDLQGSRTTASIDVGATQVRRSRDSDSGWNELVRLKTSRRISPASTLTFEAARQLSDAGEQFHDLESGIAGAEGSQPVQQVGDVFTHTHGTIRWDLQSRRTAVSALVSYFDEQYETQEEFDRRRWEYELGLQRELGPDIAVTFGGQYSEQDYRRVDRQFSEWSAYAGLDWQLGVHTYFSLVYEYFDRSDDVDTGQYSANEVWLRVGYSGGNVEGSRNRHLGAPIQ